MTTKTYTMGIRLTPEIRKELREEAKKQHRTPSDLVRVWILEKLQRATYLAAREQEEAKDDR